MKFENEINKLNSSGFIILDISEYKTELSNLGLLVENKFKEALDSFNDNKNTGKFEHFTSRPERGSLDLNILPDVESSVTDIIKNSVVSKLAKEFWKTDSLMYSKNFSKFRYVNPNMPEQLKYSPLHYDGAFMEGRSINVCIPFTGYGGPYPGLDIFRTSKIVSLIRNTFGEGKAQRYLKLFVKKTEPFLEVGKCLCFTQNIYHRRSVGNKTKERINLEYRIFPNNNIGLQKIL